MVSHFIVHRKLQEQSSKDLLFCVKQIYLNEYKKILNCDFQNPRNVYKELFKRLILPLYLPLLILIACLNVLNSKENKNYNRNRFLTFLFGILILTISESSLGFIQNEIFYNLLIILIPIVSILIIYTLILYSLSIVGLNINYENLY